MEEERPPFNGYVEGKAGRATGSLSRRRKDGNEAAV